MKHFIITAFLIVASYTSVLSQSWISSNQIESTDDIVVIQSAITGMGEVISFGYFYGTMTSRNNNSITSNGDRDYFIIKFNTEGGVDWMKAIGSNLKDYQAGGVGVDIDNNIYISGGFQNYLKYSDSDSIESTGTYDIFIAKYDNAGNAVWARNCGSGPNWQVATAMTVGDTENIIVAGLFWDSISIQNNYTLYTKESNGDYFYAEYSTTDGTIQWIKHARSLAVKSGTIWDIETNAESIALAGFFYDSIGFETDTIVPYNNFQDAQLIYTDLSGNISWTQKISGNVRDIAYTVTYDDENNIYVGGYYNSDTIIFYRSEEDSVIVAENNGSYDLLIAKYLSDGTLDWFKVVGGNGEDKIIDMEFFDDRIYLAGYFSDTLNWGGISLISKGINDRDMFTAALDKDGNFREANQYYGRNNSSDEATNIFKNGDNLLTVMRSNSDLLVLGDSIYTADGLTNNMYIGIIGCNPISIDNVISQDVLACYGDSTGSLQILASGGFGAPWKYSIDNGLNYEDIAFFADLPAGDYPIVVIDAENCAQPGPTETVDQPDSLWIESVTYKDISAESDGEIVVAVAGGSAPYTYTLQPGGIVQGFGTYTFAPGEEGDYVVEVNDAQNCGPKSTDTIAIIVLSDGVALSELGVKLYPNPSSGVITLEMPFDGTECTLKVLSLTGQVMMSQQVYSYGGVIKETIDFSDLSKGMYMICVDGQTLRSGVVLK